MENNRLRELRKSKRFFLRESIKKYDKNEKTRRSSHIKHNIKVSSHITTSWELALLQLSVPKYHHLDS